MKKTHKIQKRNVRSPYVKQVKSELKNIDWVGFGDDLAVRASHEREVGKAQAEAVNHSFEKYVYPPRIRAVA